MNAVLAVIGGRNGTVKHFRSWDKAERKLSPGSWALHKGKWHYVRVATPLVIPDDQVPKRLMALRLIA